MKFIRCYLYALLQGWGHAQSLRYARNVMKFRRRFLMETRGRL